MTSPKIKSTRSATPPTPSPEDQLAQKTLRAFLKSAPKPGEWISLRTWVDAANLVAKLKLDGVEISTRAGGEILREIGFVSKHTKDGPKFAVTKAGLRELEKAVGL